LLLRVLNAKSAGKFFEGVSELLAATSNGGPRLPEHTEIVRMMRVFLLLDLDVRDFKEGIGRFLFEKEEGGYALEARDWCRTIKAARASEYLDAAIQLFPGARVPKDWGPRLEHLTAIEKDLVALDRRFKDSLNDLWSRFRDYLRDRQAETLAALAAAPPRRSLDAAMAIADGLEFLDGLVEFCRPAGSILPDLADQPAFLRAILLLRGVILDVGSGGIWKFIEEAPVGGYVGETEDWCHRIGAERAAAYLAAATACFPDAHIPGDPAARRAILDEFSERSTDPLDAVDRTYKGALEEIPERLREYLRANPDVVHGAVLPVSQSEPSSSSGSTSGAGSSSRSDGYP
jgi:hypothetical protein